MPNFYQSEAQRQRVDVYDVWQRIFDSCHDQVFVDDLKALNERDRKKYIVANFGALIAKASADLLFGEPLLFKSPDDTVTESAEAMRKRSSLDARLWETALEGSYLGDAFLKARLDPDAGGAIIEPVDPRFVEIKTDPANVNKIVEFTIAYPLRIGQQNFVRLERRLKGLIVNELYVLDGEQLGAKAPLSLMGPGIPDSQATGVDGFLMAHIPNFKATSRTLYGRSDFNDLKSLFGALNNRITRDDIILDKHASPKLAVPPGVLNEKGAVRRETFEMFEVGASQNSGLLKPEYITWDGNLEHSREHLNRLMAFIFLVSETAPDLFGMGDGSGAGGAKAESGRALRLRLQRTLAKISRKKRYYDLAIEQIIREAGMLESINNMGKDLTTLSISFQDGLPSDVREETEMRQIDRQAGVVSVEQAVRERNPDWSEDQIDEEVQRIHDETSATIPVDTSTPDAPPPTDGNQPPPTDDTGELPPGRPQPPDNPPNKPAAA